MFSVFWALDLLKPMQDGFANEADHASRLKAWLSEAETNHVTFKKPGPIYSLHLAHICKTFKTCQKTYHLQFFDIHWVLSELTDSFNQDILPTSVMIWPGHRFVGCRSADSENGLADLDRPKGRFSYGVGRRVFLTDDRWKYWFKFDNCTQADGNK